MDHMGGGIFTLSLDFELHWGGFEKWPLQSWYTNQKISKNGETVYDQYFMNTRQVIPTMLSMFDQYKVHATWATVGMLFHKSKDDLVSNFPESTPSYCIKELSAYSYIEKQGVGDGEVDDPFHFAPTLIEKIATTPYQELGTHTFAHFYCKEDGQTSEEFRQDLKAAQRAAMPFGVTLKSLVFPRNQFNDDYLRVCFQEGITSVRSNPLDWFWDIESAQGESFWKRLNRGLDAYFSIGRKNTYKTSAITVRPGMPICLPASRLLRPYRPAELILNNLKIARIKSEMSRAAIAGEVYHLWWHPHNFGWYPEESTKGLAEILEHYKICADQYGMVSMNMGELAESLHSIAVSKK